MSQFMPQRSASSWRTFQFLAAAVVLILAGSAYADGPTDHERARKSLSTGRIAPLAKVFAKVEELFEGEILEVNLEDPNYKGGDDGGAAGGTDLSLAASSANRQENSGGFRKESGGGGGAGGEGPGDGKGLSEGKGLDEGKDEEDLSKSQDAVLAGKDDAEGIFYIIKLLSPQGNVLRIEIDAKTVQVLKVSGRGADLAKRKKKKG